MQPHSFVGGSNYHQLGNVAGPRHSVSRGAHLGGMGTFVAGVGGLSAASFLYGIVQKRPENLRLGYIGAAALATMPVALDMWLQGGKRYGNLTSTGMLGTYASLVAPPVFAMFAGSQLGNYVMSGAPKPKTRKRSWYQGALAGRRSAKSEDSGDYMTEQAEQKKIAREAEKNKSQNKRRGRGRKKRGGGSRKGEDRPPFDLSDLDFG